MLVDLFVFKKVQRAKFQESLHREHSLTCLTHVADNFKKNSQILSFLYYVFPSIKLSDSQEKKKKTRIQFNSLLNVICTQLHRLHGILQSESFHVVFGFHSQVGDA